MKFMVFTHDTQQNIELKNDIESKFIANGFFVDEDNPDFVFTVGGDGTVLQAIHHFIATRKLSTIKFVGLHTGHLGYYTDWLPSEVDEMVSYFTTQEIKTNNYPLLEANITTTNQKKSSFYALNEFTILNARRTQHLDVKINDLFFESFRGTGICVSSPTGSTAYSKALGGAVIYPSLPVYQMTEIASINNNSYRTLGSPLIIPQDQLLILDSENWEGTTLTQDHLDLKIADISGIKITLSDRCVQFAQRKEGLFWNRVKHHFL